MLIPVPPLNVVLTIIAHFSGRATLFLMHNPLFYFENLITPGARPRLHITVLLMVSKLVRGSLEWTVLALYRFVGGLFVLFSLSLGHDLATFATLVVVSCASDLVHSKLADADWTLAGAANFSLLRLSDSFCHFSSLNLISKPSLGH